MVLRARVQRSTGATRHYRAHIADGELIKDELLPTAASVVIQPEDGAFLLLYLDEHGECLVDTWHPTVEAAKSQARFEFDIGEADWDDVGT